MKKSSKIIGAAFLMATSAIGPGFLTQTAFFTEKLLASFGFVILISVVIDIITQVGIWKVLTSSGLRANVLGNLVFPYLGDLLAIFIFVGGLCFNIGNIGGAGLAIETMFGLDVKYGAIFSSMVAISLFFLKDFQVYLDYLVKILGGFLIFSVIFLLIKVQSNFSNVFIKTFVPDIFDANATLTLIGGTVGGYISFAGAHRLIDGGITGQENQKKVVQSAFLGIFTASVFRYILFLAALSILMLGNVFNAQNPAESIFILGLGDFGKYLFSLVLWCAAITSVIGAAYTSISFINSNKLLANVSVNKLIIYFILISTAIFVILGKPVAILVFVGYLNAFVLPLGLSIVLIASHNKVIFKVNPINGILRVGIVVVIVSMTYLAIKSLI